MPPGLRVDWFRVLLDLDNAGFPTLDVADQTEIPRTTLMGWKQGAEPRHSEGEKLLTFWSAATGGDREDIPTMENMPNAHWRRHQNCRDSDKA